MFIDSWPKEPATFGSELGAWLSLALGSAGSKERGTRSTTSSAPGRDGLVCFGGAWGRLPGPWGVGPAAQSWNSSVVRILRVATIAVTYIYICYIML